MADKQEIRELREVKEKYDAIESEEINAKEEQDRQYDTLNWDVFQYQQQDRKISPGFEKQLNDAMVSAMSVLELTTAKVLRDINSNWKTGDPLIRDLVKPVTTGFKDASTIVEHDLIRISRRTQQGSAAEQSVRTLFNSLDNYRESLKRLLEDSNKEYGRVNEQIKELNHLKARGLKTDKDLHYMKWIRELGKGIRALESYLSRLKELHDKTSNLLETTCADEGRLIDIKISLVNIITKVNRLENYVTSSKISFSPRKFIQCVLELLQSEEMKSVERQLQSVGNNIVQKRESITNSCRSQLTPEIWSEVQQPYAHTSDDDFTVPGSTVPPSQILSLVHGIRAQA